MNDRLLSLLGLARRAGRLSLGNDPVLSSMEEGKVKLVLVCPDLSQHLSSAAFHSLPHLSALQV